MFDISNVGCEWLCGVIEELTETITHVSPVEFNENNRYLPKSVTPFPGYIRYDRTPYLKEPLNNNDVDSNIRETIIMKGTQVGYTTLLESCILYDIVHISTIPIMLITAEKELAKARIENNILPMINQSGYSDILKSSDEDNKRKTGKTVDHLQWSGGYMVPFGANNANKMRSFSISSMYKDEIDGWPDFVGKDGDPDALTDSRCSAFWLRRKIFRGSTPLLRRTSKIYKSYLRGDQRKYIVLCRACSFPQSLRWERINKENGIIGGFKWETNKGVLILDSVRYCCYNCGHEHQEHDKEILFSEENGAHWKPTATALEEGIRSYHLPAMYSPVGMQPWSKCVSSYLQGYDTKEKKVRDLGKYQVFYNNILGWPFEVFGSKVSFMSVSAHRRMCYTLGKIPNDFAIKYCGSKILVLTCAIDVHKMALFVSVFGWTKNNISFVIDYWKFEAKNEEDECTLLSSSVWDRVRKLIEEKQYKDDDGTTYDISYTLIDAGYSPDTVNEFCTGYNFVHPILGRAEINKRSKIKEFYEFQSVKNTRGYQILVDIYKTRIQSILKREWHEEKGQQEKFHFNAPVDITDKQLKELTVETRREKTDEKGVTTYYWHRPNHAPNELFDLTVYNHCCIDIIAWNICINESEQQYIDWFWFWEHLEKNKVFFKEKENV